MEKVILEANERKEIKKQNTKILRNQKRVPGIFYLKQSKPIVIDVSNQAIKPLVFTSQTHLISLKIDGHEDQECVLKDVQFDPVSDEVIHFDLIGITRGEKIEIEVPVQLIGSAIGVKEGGLLQHSLHKLEVECFPKDIPERLEVNISELKIGDTIHVKDLSFENVDILNPEDSIVVSVVHPKVEKEPVVVEEGAEVEAEAEEMKEPEVIGKGKAAAEEEEKE
jgi:large subunit ribosomal protein L25